MRDLPVAQGLLKGISFCLLSPLVIPSEHREVDDLFQEERILLDTVKQETSIQFMKKAVSTSVTYAERLGRCRALSEAH